MLNRIYTICLVATLCDSYNSVIICSSACHMYYFTHHMKCVLLPPALLRECLGRAETLQTTGAIHSMS